MSKKKAKSPVGKPGAAQPAKAAARPPLWVWGGLAVLVVIVAAVLLSQGHRRGRSGLAGRNLGGAGRRQARRGRVYSGCARAGRVD